jgi:hypothetical protein
MKNVLVIGKNSYFYKQVKHELSFHLILVEISHTEVHLFSKLKDIHWDYVLIFARVQDVNFLSRINNGINSRKFVLISSIILNLPEKFRYYSYYREKHIVEKWFVSIFESNFVIIRSGTIENNSSLIYSIYKCLPI